MGKYEDNAKLLDKKGKWVESREVELLAKYQGKIMIGFLADSNYNVAGLMSKGVNKYVNMNGYYCTHYRELTRAEAKQLTDYRDAH